MNQQSGVAAAISLAAAAMAVTAWPQPAEREPSWYVEAVRSSAASARQFGIEAGIEVFRKFGEGHLDSAGAYQVRLASRGSRRYALAFRDEQGREFHLTSDGSGSTLISGPGGVQGRLEGIPDVAAADPGTAYSLGLPSKFADPVLSANLIVPILAAAAPHGAANLEMRTFGGSGSAEESRDIRGWPILSILSPRASSGRQTLTELTINPETLTPARLNWTVTASEGESSWSTMMKVSFNKVLFGDAVPSSWFESRPANAGAATVLLPGMNGSELAGRPAPAAPVHMSSGEVARLGQLQGKPVLLWFSGPDCDACGRQKRIVEELRKESASGSLLIIEAGEGDALAHQMLQVQVVPSVVLIDRAGVVTAFLPGLQSADDLRRALTASAAPGPTR